MLGRLGTYEVVGVVGWGGMGVVLKALDPALNRYVAIKVLAPHLGNSGAARKRFSREAQAAAAVVHENVMEIYGVAETAGLSYLVMPYVRGPSLQRRLDDDGPLALVEILRIGMQAAAGLAAAHAQGLVHRDVKPANILLADGVERVKLTDFGLARAADDASLTRTGIIAGTPQYMSPEQARGESVDQRSDLFSLGSVLYAMCTGRAPFRAETSYGVLRRITDEEPRPIRQLNPDIPEWLCRIVARLMSKQPGDRFQSAREVAELLEPCLAHVQQPTVVPLPAALPAHAAHRVSRLRSVFSKGTAAMIAALGIALLGMFLMQSTEPPDIAGRWSGEGWGQVVLRQTAAGEYAGTYAKTVGKESGKIELKWSRIERRFNGAWHEDGDCFGELSLRSADNQLRGARSTDSKSKIDPATPRLADFLWTRAKPATPAGGEGGTATPAPPLHRVCRFDPGMRRGHDRLLFGWKADRRGKRSTEHHSYRCRAQHGGRQLAAGRDNSGCRNGENRRLAEAHHHRGRRPVRRLEHFSHFEVTALAFSPDGELLAVGTSIGQIKLFNARTGKLVRSLDDEKAKLADKETPEKWKSLRRAIGRVASLAFSPDGRLLAVCGGSFADFAEGFSGMDRMGVRLTGPGRLKLWDVQTGMLKHDLVGHNDQAYAVAFSPDGNYLASAGRWMNKDDYWGNGVILWNPVSGTAIHYLIRTTANAGARAIAFSPDSKMLAMGTQRFGDGDSKSTGGVSLVHASSGVEEWLVTVPGWASPLAFSPDGKSIVVLCGGRSIRFLDIGTGTMKHEIRPADSQDARWCGFAVASQGQTLAIGGVDNKRKGSVEVWSTRRRDNANAPASCAACRCAACVGFTAEEDAGQAGADSPLLSRHARGRHGLLARWEVDRRGQRSGDGGQHQWRTQQGGRQLAAERENHRR